MHQRWGGIVEHSDVIHCEPGNTEGGKKAYNKRPKKVIATKYMSLPNAHLVPCVILK